ncbi:MAG: DoxX family protein [Patescibacteria group bacterium]
MNGLHAMMHRLHNTDLGILFLRIALGVVFLHAGYLKVSDMTPVLAGFGSLGIPVWLSYVVAYAELVAGVALLLGIFVRYFGIVLAVIMFVAAVKVHFANGFGLQGSGYEYTFVLFFGSLAMVTFGSGKYSLAALLRKK